MTDLHPERPAEAGVPEKTPKVPQTEAARILANDARPALKQKGFDDRQIELWANSFVEEEPSGDVEAFLAWIDKQQD